MLALIFASSVLLSKWLRKKEKEPRKKLENIVAFGLTLLAGTVYFALHEQWISTAYHGDIIISEKTARVVEHKSVRYVSNERPIHLLELYTYGFPYKLSIENEQTISIKIDDYHSFYKEVHDSTFHADNGMFDFQAYVVQELGPTITEVFMRSEKGQELDGDSVLSDLKEALPFYEFELY